MTGTVIGNLATFALVPVVLAYFGVLFHTQRSGTHADLKRLVTMFALPVFATLNTLAVVTRPPTALTRIFSPTSGWRWRSSAGAGSRWGAANRRSRGSDGPTRSRRLSSVSPSRPGMSSISPHSAGCVARRLLSLPRCPPRRTMLYRKGTTIVESASAENAGKVAVSEGVEVYGSDGKQWGRVEAVGAKYLTKVIVRMTNYPWWREGLNVSTPSIP